MHINVIHLWYEQFQYSIETGFLHKKNPTIAFKGNTAFHANILVALGIPNFV